MAGGYDAVFTLPTMGSVERNGIVETFDRALRNLLNDWKNPFESLDQKMLWDEVMTSIGGGGSGSSNASDPTGGSSSSANGSAAQQAMTGADASSAGDGQPNEGGEQDNSKIPYSVMVLQDPDGAKIGYPQGHTALLVGNEKDGYTYMSKDGGASGSSGEADYAYEKGFKSFSDFVERHKDGKRYKDVILYTTTKDVGLKVEAEAAISLKKNYNVISCNCVGTVLDGLYNAGLTNVHPNAQRTHQPNRIFLELVYERRGIYVQTKR